MEIDLFLDVSEVGSCGAACLAEIVIGLVATRKGRFAVIISKIAGLAFEILGVVLLALDGEIGYEFYLLSLLIIWERVVMIYLIVLYFMSLGGWAILNCITCCCCKCIKKKLAKKKENSILTLPLVYKEYAEITSEKYQEPKKTRFVTLTQDAMKSGLATLYYGALFCTTDYMGAIWKSDSSKWGCFFVIYFFSIMYVSFFGLAVIIVTLILPGDNIKIEMKVVIALSLYMNALGAFQHWVNLSHGIYEKCLLRNEIRKESTIRASTIMCVIQNSEMTKTETQRSQENETPPQSQENETPPQSQENETTQPSQPESTVGTAQVIQPEQMAMPHGWSSKVDPNGRVYYQNEITKETQLQHPGNASNEIVELEVNRTDTQSTDTRKKSETSEKSETKSKKQRRKSSAVVSDKRRAKMAKKIMYKSKRVEWKEKCCCGLYWCCFLWICCGIRDCCAKCCTVCSRGGRRRGCCCKYFGMALGLIVLLTHFATITYGIVGVDIPST